MKAVIMAAGESTRTHPLTVDLPKPLVRIANREMLFHNMDTIEPFVQGYVIVVGFNHQMIMDKVGSSYRGKPVEYVIQGERLGTGHALQQAEKHCEGKVLVINGDDLYSARDIESCIRHDNCVLSKEVEDPSGFGVFVLKDGLVEDVVEKPSEPISNKANTGLYVFQPSIFRHLKNVKKSVRGEYELTDAIRMLAREEPVHCISIKDYWMPVGYPWSFIKANRLLLSRRDSFIIEGSVEEGAAIEGSVELGKGSVVSAGSSIRGPAVIGEGCVIENSSIGPFTSIGDSCRIGEAKLENSIIMDGVGIGDGSEIGHSVIGPGSEIGAGTRVETHCGGKSVKTMVKGSMADSGMKEMGTVTGSGVSIGPKTRIMAGCKIWPGMRTEEESVIEQDLK